MCWKGTGREQGSSGECPASEEERQGLGDWERGFHPTTSNSARGVLQCAYPFTVSVIFRGCIEDGVYFKCKPLKVPYPAGLSRAPASAQLDLKALSYTAYETGPAGTGLKSLEATPGSHTAGVRVQGLRVLLGQHDVKDASRPQGVRSPLPYLSPGWPRSAARRCPS